MVEKYLIKSSVDLDELGYVGLNERHDHERGASSRKKPVKVDDVRVLRTRAQRLHLSVDILIL